MSKRSEARALMKARKDFGYEAPSLDGVLQEDIGDEKFRLTQLDIRLRDQQLEGKPIGFMGDAWRRFRKNKISLAALIIIGVVILLALFGPALRPYTFRTQHTNFSTLPPRVQFLEKLGILDGTKVFTITGADLGGYGDAVVKIIDEYVWTVQGKDVPMIKAKINMYIYKGAADHYFWFGTDELGRDLFVRLWRGARISLVIGFVSAILNCVIGVVYGSVSGYYGGKIDMLMQRFIEIIGSVPNLVIVILLIMVLGAGIQSFILAMILTNWIGTSRMIRAQFYRYKNHEYVMASRIMGAKDRILIFRHILPNAIGPTITATTLAVPQAIFTESFLSFLGLGIQAPEPSIGVLLADGQQVLTTQPHMVLFPALIISILMMAFNMFGNGLRDAFDPKQRGAEEQ